VNLLARFARRSDWRGKRSVANAKLRESRPSSIRSRLRCARRWCDLTIEDGDGCRRSPQPRSSAFVRTSRREAAEGANAKRSSGGLGSERDRLHGRGVERRRVVEMAQTPILDPAVNGRARGPDPPLLASVFAVCTAIAVCAERPIEAERPRQRTRRMPRRRSDRGSGRAARSPLEDYFGGMRREPSRRMVSPLR
jgi:hypothetical protein